MRVRWGNAGRAAVVLAVLALAVAWPRLAPPAPRLPGDSGIPVATPTPEPTRHSRPPKKPSRRPKRAGHDRTRRKPAPREPQARRKPLRAPRLPARQAAAPAPAPAPTAAPPPARRVPAPSFRPQDPATQEFSFESG